MFPEEPASTPSLTLFNNTKRKRSQKTKRKLLQRKNSPVILSKTQEMVRNN